MSITKKIRYNNSEVLSVDSATHVFNPNETVTYRIFIGNGGSATANNITVTDFLPNFLKWKEGDGSYDSGANKVNFTIGTLNAGASVTLTYVAQVVSSLPAGLHSQQNTAVLYENNSEKGRASTFIWVGTPAAGQILGTTAPTRLPVSGGGEDFLKLTGLLGMLGSGIGLKLRKLRPIAKRLHITKLPMGW